MSEFFFEQAGFGDRERERLKKIKVDTTKVIRKIGMIVDQDDQPIGLRLVDEKGVYIVNQTWFTKESQASDWITRTIPAGRDIIGLRCSYGANNHITSLSFMMWTPRVEREKKTLQSKTSFLFGNSPTLSSPSPLFKQRSDY